MGGKPIKEVESFVYLGSTITKQGGTDEDVTSRIGKQTCHSIELKNLDLTNKKSGSGGKNRDHGPIGYKKK